MKRCGLYIRVSSEKQAEVEEGSLKNQEQMLRDFIRFKQLSSEEAWEIEGVYIDRGKSAKDTKRLEYQRMMKGVEAGRINAVVCAALSRISRSTRDLLDLVDYLDKKEVDFISLKEQFDTTTAQGKCFLTIMAALNQFEREQTSERTQINMLERAKRGLWQGSQILGYNLDPSKKGYLLINEVEAKLVNFLFDTYLETGSVERVAEIADRQGFRGKEYTTHKGRLKTAKKFCYSAIRKILMNWAYVGVREWSKINKGMPADALSEEEKYVQYPAVWPPIIDRDKFDKVQNLLKENHQHKNNGAKPTKHSYLFNGEMLACHKCGYRMEGRNGHGKTGKVYFYYYCVNPDCRHKVPELELEESVAKVVESLATKPVMLNRITDKMNEVFRNQAPLLNAESKHISAQLDTVMNEANAIMSNLSGLSGGRRFVEQRLSELEDRRLRLEEALKINEKAMKTLEQESISEDNVRRLLGKLAEVFRHHLKPYEKKSILRWLLEKIRVGGDVLKIGVDTDRFKSDITHVLRGNLLPGIPGGSLILKGHPQRCPFKIYSL